MGRYNSDLANGLGNLASRTLNMIQQYRDGKVPESNGDPAIADFTNVAATLSPRRWQAYDRFEFSRALELIWSHGSGGGQVHCGARALETGREEFLEARQRLDETLSHRGGSAANHLRARLSRDAAYTREDLVAAGLRAADSAAGRKIDLGEIGGEQKMRALLRFSPLDLKMTVAKMKDLEALEVAHQAQMLGKAPVEIAEPKPIAKIAPTITIDDFARLICA